MSETISEMILPGTYIDVRAEGLIGVGGISTGNVGVIGTASRGPINQVVVLGTYSDAIDTFGPYDRWPDPTDKTTVPLSLTRTLEQLFSGGASSVYAVRIASGTPAAATWDVDSGAAATLFTLTARSPGTWANAIQMPATLTPDSNGVITLTLQLGAQKETFTGKTAGDLAAAIGTDTTIGASESRFVMATVPAVADAGTVPKTIAVNAAGGPDGASVSSVEVAAGLALLADRTYTVNILVVGGADAKTLAAPILAHLEATENDGQERIAVVGASTDVPADLITNDSSKGSSPRLILVAPGIVADDAARAGESNTAVRLPPAYTAAMIAGKIATLAPHISLTNQGLPAEDLTTTYSRAQQKLLLLSQVLVVHKELGIRVLKGITTDTGAFKQITVRRIVDYAKSGVRQGSNPYIGKLNNVRVRAALKATLDGFLSQMVLDEMLVAYQLDVSATRAQEINGQAIVTMLLQPTFSIDFVKVIMNLQ